MILKTSVIKKFSKLLEEIKSSDPEDYVFLDILNSCLYLSTDTTTAKLRIILEDKPADIQAMIFIKKNFLHVIGSSSEDSLVINPDYSYRTSTFQGKFERNDSFLSVIENFISMFEEEASYSELLTFDPSNLRLFKRASIFVNVTDKSTQARAIHIQDGSISSSSLYRFYFNSYEPKDIAEILPHSLISCILSLGNGSILKKYNNSFLLAHDDISIIFTSFDEAVKFLPIQTDQFKEVISSLKAANTVTFNKKVFLDKMDFIYFFALPRKNKMTRFYKSGNEITLEVGENKVIIPYVSASDGNFDFHCDISFIKGILSSLVNDTLPKNEKDNETFTLYEKNELKVFLLHLSGDEHTLLSKINI